jgi:hypothetical protein
MNLRPLEKGKAAFLGLAAMARGLLGTGKFFGKKVELARPPAPASPEEIQQLRAAVARRLFGHAARPNRAIRRKLAHRARLQHMAKDSRRINAGLL